MTGRLSAHLPMSLSEPGAMVHVRAPALPAQRFIGGGLGGGRPGPLRFKIAEGPPEAIRNDPQVIDAYLGGAED